MRVDWSPDGSELLAVVNGTLRRGDAILDGPEILDARWRTDGSIVAIDSFNRAKAFGGEPIDLARQYQLVLSEARLTRKSEYLGVAGGAVFVASIEGRDRWRFDQYKHSLTQIERKTATISDDGAVVAIGYETGSYANYSWQRKEGRGWLVVNTHKDKVLDRSWGAIKRAPEPMQLALDAKGKRLAMATVEPGPCLGAVRLGKDETYVKTYDGGARAVAIDDRGILAAYAYPRGTTPRKLRVDYLDPLVKPTSQIAITETLWIDPDIDNIVALAFDRASRKIACLDASGTIDVVPVP